MGVLSLQTGRAHDTRDLLDVLDALRADVEAGKVIAFVAAGIDASDVSYGYCSSIGSVTRLRMIGAIANLLNQYSNGELSDE